MSATVSGDMPRPRKKSIPESTNMAEKIGRLGALYEGLDGKVDAVDNKVEDFGRKLDAHIEKSNTQHQEIKNILLAKQVAHETRDSIISWMTARVGWVIVTAISLGIVISDWFRLFHKAQ